MEDVEETATIAAATKTQTHLTSSKNMMNTHTIIIIYQFRVLIQFIFCAFRNGAKRRNYCVPLKRWKRKREYFRSIPKLYEENSDAKKPPNQMRVFFFGSPINRLLFPLVIFVMICHTGWVFSIFLFAMFYFSCYFCYFCNYLYCLSLYPKKVLFILGDMVKRCRRVVLLRHSVACLSLKHLN